MPTPTLPPPLLLLLLLPLLLPTPTPKLPLVSGAGVSSASSYPPLSSRLAVEKAERVEAAFGAPRVGRGARRAAAVLGRFGAPFKTKTTTTTRKYMKMEMAVSNVEEGKEPEEAGKGDAGMSDARRTFLSFLLVTSSLSPSSLSYSYPLVPSMQLNPASGPIPAAVSTTTTMAMADASSAASSAPVTPKDVLARMRPIPTFAIVDGATGKPYMIADKQGQGATGYFFTTFRGASLVLDEAKRAAERDGYAEVWSNAAIVVVPLDIAVRLAFKKLNRTGQNDLKMDTICDIIASAEAYDDAMKYDTTGRYKQQGTVPLFYIESLELYQNEGTAISSSSSSSSSSSLLPAYFSKRDLIEEWNRLNPDNVASAPQVKVLDLIDSFRSMMKTGSNANSGSNTSPDALLKRLVFIPPADTINVAKELKSKESVPQYKMNEMLAVGGK